MKLFKEKEPYLTKEKVRQILLAVTIITIGLYIIGAICSLSGSSYFILDFHSERLENIENFFTSRGIMPMLNFVFSTIEFYLVLAFVLKKLPNILYPIAFYGIAVGLAFIVKLPTIVHTLYPLPFYLVCPIIDQLVDTHKVEWKEYGRKLIRVVVALAITLFFQFLIEMIKGGYFDGSNHVMNLPTTFIYAVEYEIALLVVLATTTLFLDREKGDNNLWMIYQPLGGSSQTSRMRLSQSNPNVKRTITKTQKKRLKLLWLKISSLQIIAFLVIMVTPFLFGKVFEFLVMYFVFLVLRYIMGFKYSLHFKKESICITVGVLVFGILSLVVPYFSLLVILAIVEGAGLAIILHLSYKHKGMWLFLQMANKDRYALFNVFFDGEKREPRLRAYAKHYGLDYFETELLVEYMNHYKLSYLSKKFNYSQRAINNKLDAIIDKLDGRM